MALEIYREPFCRRHYAGRFSLAFWFRALGLAGCVVLAFVIAFATGGFWVRTGTYTEQPKVAFTYDVMLALEVRFCLFPYRPRQPSPSPPSYPPLSLPLSQPSPAFPPLLLPPLPQGEAPGQERFWSSYPALNSAVGAQLLAADVGALPRDLNHDGITDVIDISVRARGMPVVKGVKMLVQFSYK
jgi:hypothetical protein